MLLQERRMYVRLISTQVLRDYMKFRGETNASLGAKCAPYAGRSIIGHLRSGFRQTCSPDTAKAIERALNAPPGSLFLAEVIPGSAADSHAVRAAS